jgi:hypothetical protein
VGDSECIEPASLLPFHPLGWWGIVVLLVEDIQLCILVGLQIMSMAR